MITDLILRSGYANKLVYDHDMHIKKSSMVGQRQVVLPRAVVWESAPRSYLVAFRNEKDTLCDFVRGGGERFNFKDKSVIVRGKILNVFSMLEEELTESLKGAKCITFTGHGFGGALAIFASAYYSHLYENIQVNCHTFGASRVGDERFIEWYRTGVGDSVNLAMSFDTVTWAPFLLSSCIDYVLVDMHASPLQSHDIDMYLTTLARKKQS